jgi:hypothetical protein
MKKVLFVFVGLLLFGCSLKHDPRIVGTFISDKEVTMSYLQGTGKFTDRQLALFESLLGKLRVESDGVTVVSTMDDFTYSEPLRIVERESEYIVTESKFLGETIKYKFIFTDDGYWSVGGISGPYYREKFRRINKSVKEPVKQ